MVLLELKHFRDQWRFLSLLLCVALGSFMADPAVLIFTTEDALVSRAAALTWSPETLAWWFTASGLCLVPHALASVFNVPGHYSRHTVRLAVLGLCSAALEWAMLAYVSRPLEIWSFMFICARNGALCLAFGFALAISINNQQLRDEARDDETDQT